MLSDPIGCNQTGRAQQTLPRGAGTAPQAVPGTGNATSGGESRDRVRPAPPQPEIRWVGAQHLMHGYCGRATAGAEVAAAAGMTAATVTAGARAYAVRPTALLEGRRSLVVRVGPRRAESPAARAAVPAGVGEEGIGETRARAA